MRFRYSLKFVLGILLVVGLAITVLANLKWRTTQLAYYAPLSESLESAQIYVVPNGETPSSVIAILGDHAPRAQFRRCEYLFGTVHEFQLADDTWQSVPEQGKLFIVDPAGGLIETAVDTTHFDTEYAWEGYEQWVLSDDIPERVWHW